MWGSGSEMRGLRSGSEKEGAELACESVLLSDVPQVQGVNMVEGLQLSPSGVQKKQ